VLFSDSFLEYAFLRWILSPAFDDGIAQYIVPQKEVIYDNHKYYIDYAIIGKHAQIAVELDGYEFHSRRDAFSYDRLRQNDLHANGWIVVRFSYEGIRVETARCVAQLQKVCAQDPFLGSCIRPDPPIEKPDMNPDPLFSLNPSPLQNTSLKGVQPMYFDNTRTKLNRKTLRLCQLDALDALANFYRAGGNNAACVMSVGAGKTALGVAACLVFAKRRALIITPGNVIRGTFDKALNHQAVGNVLYGLPGGPLIPGSKPPKVVTLSRDDAPIHEITHDHLLDADIIVTNFHSLGTGEDPDDLLAKLNPQDIDYIVVDEAHIAAASSYQRTFHYFKYARTLLMSACFQRLDGKPIDADVVYRYRLIDSIADGNAKNLRVQRFTPEAEETTYEIVWPDGRRDEIAGRNALVALIQDERKIARITAKSDMSIRQIMRSTKSALIRQRELLFPVKPRVLFSALGERHAEQITRIANEYGIQCEYLHHSMTENRIKAIRARFEQDSGDLEAIVQLKMLGQGYDFPPISVVVPMRPYGSFSEFYQFIGRGIRVLQHPALQGRVEPAQQFLEIIYHAELGLDEHIETIYRENDMDPLTQLYMSLAFDANAIDAGQLPGSHGIETVSSPDMFVLFEQGAIEQRVIHDEARIEQRRTEREREALAQRYAKYVETTPNPITFEQFIQLLRMINE
jgi:superfamily II DNA or RNA helicase